MPCYRSDYGRLVEVYPGGRTSTASLDAPLLVPPRRNGRPSRAHVGCGRPLAMCFGHSLKSAVLTPKRRGTTVVREVVTIRSQFWASIGVPYRIRPRRPRPKYSPRKSCPRSTELRRRGDRVHPGVNINAGQGCGWKPGRSVRGIVSRPSDDGQTRPCGRVRCAATTSPHTGTAAAARANRSHDDDARA